MTKTLYADGSSGRVFIYNNASPPSEYDSVSGAKLSDLHFHSDLSYIGSTEIVQASINHPQRTRDSESSKFGSDTYKPRTGTSDYRLGPNNLNATSLFVVVYNGYQAPSGTRIQQRGESIRLVSVYLTSSEVRLHETWSTFDNTLYATTQTYTVYIIRKLFNKSGTAAIQVNPSGFTAGYGKLDTAYKYIRRSDASPTFYVSPYKTADVRGGGYKVVTADGSSYQSNTYTGSFSGASSTGVKV